jgi:RecA/RadA recombinase
MFGSPETTAGGNALKFYSSVRMDIRRIGTVKDGDEVLVSSSTNMACAFSISHCNAKPVPIDIHKKNWQMKV